MKPFHCSKCDCIITVPYGICKVCKEFRLKLNAYDFSNLEGVKNTIFKILDSVECEKGE